MDCNITSHPAPAAGRARDDPAQDGGGGLGQQSSAARGGREGRPPPGSTPTTRHAAIMAPPSSLSFFKFKIFAAVYLLAIFLGFVFILNITVPQRVFSLTHSPDMKSGFNHSNQNQISRPPSPETHIKEEGRAGVNPLSEKKHALLLERQDLISLQRSPDVEYVMLMGHPSVTNAIDMCNASGEQSITRRRTFPNQELRLIQLNIYNGCLDIDRLSRLTKWISAQQVDVLGLNELVGWNTAALAKIGHLWGFKFSVLMPGVCLCIL